MQGGRGVRIRPNEIAMLILLCEVVQPSFTGEGFRFYFEMNDVFHEGCTMLQMFLSTGKYRTKIATTGAAAVVMYS